MHGYFPICHPDETLYSACARLSMLLDAPSRKGLCEALFGPGSIAVYDLPSRLSYFASRLPPGHPTAEEFLLKHTLLPLFLPFMPVERADQCRRDALGRNGKGLPFRAGVIASVVKPPAALRLCPQCAQSEPEPYWHRSHQVAGVTACADHRCLLVETDVRRGGRTNRHDFLPPPEPATPRAPTRPATAEETRLAADTRWLLNGNAYEPGHVRLKEGYARAAREIGLAHPSGRLHLRELQRLFADFHGTLLAELGCPVEPGNEHCWFAEMFRGRNRCAHPVQHLLLIHFLGHTTRGFFELVRLGKTTEIPSPKPKTSRATKTFDADVLRQLWMDPVISLREIGRRFDDSDPMTIKRHAAKADLPFPRRATRPATIRPTWAAPKPSRLEHHRRRWLEAMSQPDPTRLRDRLPSTYSYLYRFDRQWLESHRPPPAIPSNVARNMRQGSFAFAPEDAGPIPGLSAQGQMADGNTPDRPSLAAEIPIGEPGAHPGSEVQLLFDHILEETTASLEIRPPALTSDAAGFPRTAKERIAARCPRRAANNLPPHGRPGGTRWSPDEARTNKYP